MDITKVGQEGTIIGVGQDHYSLPVPPTFNSQQRL